MSLSGFSDEQLEDWREGDVTRAFAAQLAKDHANYSQRLEEMGAAGDSPYKTAATAGAAAELRRVLSVIATKGKTE